MAFTVKATAIVPKGFDVGKIKGEIDAALEQEGVNDRAILNKTIEGWDGEKPTMAYETQIKSNEASVWIGPKGSESSVEKWRRIDEGTEERGWTSANTMVFPWQGYRNSYDAKTRPRQFSSGGPGTKHGTTRRTKTIKRHSIDAREWSKTLGEQRIKPFAENVQAAIDRGIA
jgi:hypothetical protein